MSRILLMSYCQISTRGSDDSCPTFLHLLILTVALIDQAVNDGPIAVATKVEVPRNTIDFKKAFHPASLLLVDVLNDSLQLLIIVHVLIAVDHIVRNYYLLQVLFHVH